MADEKFLLGQLKSFQTKKVHQNQTIIKEVTSKLLLGLARALGQVQKRLGRLAQVLGQGVGALGQLA